MPSCSCIPGHELPRRSGQCETDDHQSGQSDRKLGNVKWPQRVPFERPKDIMFGTPLGYAGVPSSPPEGLTGNSLVPWAGGWLNFGPDMFCCRMSLIGHPSLENRLIWNGEAAPAPFSAERTRGCGCREQATIRQSPRRRIDEVVLTLRPRVEHPRKVHLPKSKECAPVVVPPWVGPTTWDASCTQPSRRRENSQQPCRRHSVPWRQTNPVANKKP